MPPGGTLRQRLCHALERGHSVLVFPDGPIGAPAHLSRFRLDAFHAALATGSPIIPVAVRKWKFENRKSKTEVRLSDPIQAEMARHRELSALREQLRETIAKLCQLT
jgi:1-acyl-sn-glycerol-3-phosphate acyltransferase